MPDETRYAVKIGEIHLRSNQPITEEQRISAAFEAAATNRNFRSRTGVEVANIISADVDHNFNEK